LTPRVAWVLRCLLCNISLNGEIDLLNEPWKGIATHLAGLPKEDRQAQLDIMLIGRLDRDEVRQALIDVDPNKPMPPGDGDAADEWEPIRLGTLPPVEPFPLHVLPLPARHLAEAVTESIGCPVDFPAAAILAVASGLIGRSASLLIKPGYFESASLYIAMVGIPSSGKSPALKAAMAPAMAIAEQLRQDGKPTLDAWKKEDPKTRGEKPNLTRIISTDFTVEALGGLLAANPRGLILTKDEMSQWVASMDQYKGGGKGGDRQHFLSWWSGVTDYIDRVKNLGEPIVVPHPFLTVVGGITPDMLGSLSEKKGRDDGFMARLLFPYPDWSQGSYTERGISEGVAEAWAKVCQAIWDRQMIEKDGKLTPHVFKWGRQAAIAWVDWVNAHRDEQGEDDFIDSMKGPWGKFEAYAGRLSLNLHLMRIASDPDRSPDDPSELPRSIIDDAAKLIVYFKSHTRRVYTVISGRVTHGGDDVKALIRWILRGELAEFSTRDIGMNFHRFRDDPAVLSDALGWMTSHNLIRPCPDPEAPNPSKPGRKRAPSFDVNPHLRTAPRFQQFQRNPGSRVDSVGNVGNVARP